MQAMLKITDLHVNYGSFQALMGVNMEVKEGGIIALLGSNGAGKSTTINAVSGIVKAASGKIEFMGQDITNMPVNERVKMGLIQCPEGRRLFPEMSILDNLKVGSYLPSARAKRDQNLELVFELFPKLKERRNQMAGSMSGGEQQMVAIARAMMSDPKMLMMDEPSLGLAPVVVEEMFEIIKRINKESGTTVLLVEQNVAVSLEVASYAYVIENGANAHEGEAAALLADEDMKKIYLGL